MSKQEVAELERLVGELEKETGPIGSESLARVGEYVAKTFGVKPDEVAILALVNQNKSLKFILPEKLQAVGTIPMTSATALAVRTAKEKRAELTNTFTSVRHASVFEGVPLGRRHDEPIHKIMSAPIQAAGKVVGVIQVSRKGRSPTDAGPDFTPKDLQELVSISSVLGQFLKLCTAA